MAFSVTSGGLWGWKEERSLHNLLELRGNYVLGVITPKGYEGV